MVSMAEPIAPMPQPGGKAPAPGWLHLVQDFVNTRDIEGGTDVLDAAETLGRWLRRRDLLDHGDRLHDPEDLARALQLRESLRELCLANHDRQPPPPAAVEVVEAAARRAALTVARDADAGWQLQPQADGIDRGLGRLVAIVYDAISADRWWRLKACSRDVCRWVFWDGSPNRAGRWCAMAICGNRAKVTAYRDRAPRRVPRAG